MPLFKKRKPSKAAIPDFTNNQKIIEYVKGLSGNELKSFDSKLRFMKRACHSRWIRLEEEWSFIKWYEWKKEQGDFELNYCRVKWDPLYTHHIMFSRSIHKKYDRYKSYHESCDPGSGFYEYDERLKFLLKWINEITDIDFLMKVQGCCITGLNQAAPTLAAVNPFN